MKGKRKRKMRGIKFPIFHSTNPHPSALYLINLFYLHPTITRIENCRHTKAETVLIVAMTLNGRKIAKTTQTSSDVRKHKNPLALLYDIGREGWRNEWNYMATPPLCALPSFSFYMKGFRAEWRCSDESSERPIKLNEVSIHLFA